MKVLLAHPLLEKVTGMSKNAFKLMCYDMVFDL